MCRHRFAATSDNQRGFFFIRDVTWKHVWCLAFVRVSLLPVQFRLHITTFYYYVYIYVDGMLRRCQSERERERIETWDHSIDRMLLAVCLCFTIRCFPSMSTHTTMPASIGYSFALALSVWESRRRFIIKVVRQTDDDGGEWTNKECECDLCCETVCERGMRVLWRVSSWIVGQWSIHFNIFIHDMMRERDRPWKEHRHTHTHTRRQHSTKCNKILIRTKGVCWFGFGWNGHDYSLK